MKYVIEKPTVVGGRLVECAFEYRGFNCECIFNLRTGHRCGYVYIPEDHPLYLLTDDEEVLDNLSVHGGVTYSETATADGSVIGFDCGHAYDSPDIEQVETYYGQFGNELDGYLSGPILRYDSANATIKTKEFVKEELVRLADQLTPVGIFKIKMKIGEIK